MRVQRVVCEIGAGDCRKAIALARQNPRTVFEVVDLELPRLIRAPSNLHFHRSDAVDFLSSQPEDRFSGVYADFSLQHIPFDRRQELIRQAFRTMRPQAWFHSIDFAYAAPVLKAEFDRHRFETSLRRFRSIDLAAESSLASFQHALATTVLAESLRAVRRLKGEEVTVVDLAARLNHAKEVEKFLRRIEGANPSLEALRSIEDRVAMTSLTLSDKPFALLRAVKPRVK